MRLVCLECSATYEAPDNLFGPQPREVRCNRCGYQWTVIGTEASDPAEAAALSVGPPEPVAARVPAPALPPAPPTAAPTTGVPPADHPAEQVPTETPVLPSPPPRPAPIVEPAAASTRTLLAGGPAGGAMALPDAEERRLSHDLDFGEPARRRRARDESSGARRAALAIILIVILAIIAAMVFKTEIVAAFPALRAAYARLGL